MDPIQVGSHLYEVAETGYRCTKCGDEPGPGMPCVDRESVPCV